MDGIEDRREPQDRPDWVMMEEYCDAHGDDALLMDVLSGAVQEGVGWARLSLDAIYSVICSVLQHSPADGLCATLDALGWREELEARINEAPDGRVKP